MITISGHSETQSESASALAVTVTRQRAPSCSPGLRTLPRYLRLGGSGARYLARQEIPRLWDWKIPTVRYTFTSRY